MKNPIKIAIIGGTGKAGRYLVKELLKKGYPLRLLLRNLQKFPDPPPSVELIHGDAREYEALQCLLEGCQVVISTLGQPVGEPTIFSQATKNVLRAMEEWNIRRYVLTTGLNVDTPTDQKNPKVQAATDWMKTHYPKTTIDKQVEYSILTESTMDWTLVRLPLIELTDEPTEIKVSLEDCPGEHISATSLARFLVEQLIDNTYLRHAPFVASA